jgi:hypothetical protein
MVSFLVECKGRASVKLAEMIFKAPNKKGMRHEEETVVKVVTVCILFLLLFGSYSILVCPEMDVHLFERLIVR